MLFVMMPSGQEAALAGGKTTRRSVGVGGFGVVLEK